MSRRREFEPDRDHDPAGHRSVPEERRSEDRPPDGLEGSLVQRGMPRGGEHFDTPDDPRCVHYGRDFYNALEA